MFTDFGFQVCDKIYHLISQHFNPTFIEITCAELHEKLEVAATEEQIKNWLTVVNLFKPQTLLLEQVNYLNQQIDRSVTALSEKVKRHKETKDLKDKLVNSHMIDLFANSGWKDGLVTGNSFYLKKINELHNRLSQLQIVEQFHYISNPNSLIHWALTYVFILLSSFLRLSSSTFWAYSSFFYSKVCTACSYSVGSESCSFCGASGTLGNSLADTL